MSHALQYLHEVEHIAKALDHEQIDAMAQQLAALRAAGGVLYIVGLGGSAANASHMAADLRKLCEMDARSLDSMAEVTARANDEGWETIFDGFLKDMRPNDGLFVLSVGGGTPAVSLALCHAVDHAKRVGAPIFAVVGPDGGYTAAHGQHVIRIPCRDNPTPHTEAFQAVVWHCLVSHPVLQRRATKW